MIADPFTATAVAAGGTVNSLIGEYCNKLQITIVNYKKLILKLPIAHGLNLTKVIVSWVSKLFLIKQTLVIIYFRKIELNINKNVQIDHKSKTNRHQSKNIDFIKEAKIAFVIHLDPWKSWFHSTGLLLAAPVSGHIFWPATEFALVSGRLIPWSKCIVKIAQPNLVQKLFNQKK